MDDISVDAYLDVPLTSVAGDNGEVCRTLAELLLEDIERGGCAGRRVLVPGRLCLRGTVGDAKK
jgi:DNA-binding LacI/PurR family transcriptional regulator